MKKTLLFVLLAFLVVIAQAQKVEKAKTLLTGKKVAEAKTEIDNFLAIEKNKNNSDAWYTKAKVYLAISTDQELRSTVTDARGVAFDALKQYYEIESKIKDSTQRYITLLVENNQPLVDMYKGYSADGSTYFNANNFNDAFVAFGKCLDVFDFMSQKKMIPHQFDTTTTLYAGIAAEKASKPDVAATFYGKIAEKKIKSDGFIEIYKWLTDHYYRKSDLTNAGKYLSLGRQVYPEDQFWDAFDLDMVREKGTKEELFKKYEEIIAANPKNHLFVFNYGVELYQMGYQEDITKRPENSKDMIAKSATLMKKVIELKPDYANAYMVLGQLIYNEGADINNVNKKIRPPAGGKLKPEELKKKEELRNQVKAKFEEALPYFEKVEQILASQGKLKMEEKTILKEAFDLIIMINENKGNKEKAEEYTVKFNEVDKKH